MKKMSLTKENTVHIISITKAMPIKTLKLAIKTMVTEYAEVKRVTVCENKKKTFKPS